MKLLSSVISYIWSKSVTIIALFSVWIFKFDPYSYINNIFHFDIEATNQETVKGAINLAILIFVYDICGKLISLTGTKLLEIVGLKNKVEVSIKISDPTDPDDCEKIKYTFGSTLKKVELHAKIDYKRNFLKKVVTWGREHFIEIHWNEQWLTLEIDEDKAKDLNGIKENGVWKFGISNMLTIEQLDTIFRMPIYFTVNRNDTIRKGYINAKLTTNHKRKINRSLCSITTALIMDKEIKSLEIILTKGD